MFVAAAVLQGAGGAVSVVKTDSRTGRLVRTTVRPAAPAKPTVPIAEAVDRIAKENNLSPRLVHSVIQVESNYNPNAVSPKGAQGLMQLIPATARRFGVSDAFDPADNIQGGARYLKYLLELYKGDETLALAAYNAGEGAVSKYGGVPPYPETQGYVAKIRQRLVGEASVLDTPNPPVASAEAEPAGPAYNPIHVVTDANGRTVYTSQ